LVKNKRGLKSSFNVKMLFDNKIEKGEER